MAQLGRWYDVNIFFVGTRARELHFSGEIDRYEKEMQVIEKKIADVDKKIVRKRKEIIDEEQKVAKRRT